jgi:transcriptional regulator with XRE-family HTH domain
VSKSERSEISILKRKGYSLRDIARELGRSASTISDELSRNRVNGRYDPEKAHHKAYVHRKYAKQEGMKSPNTQNCVSSLSETCLPASLLQGLQGDSRNMNTLCQASPRTPSTGTSRAPTAGRLSTIAPRERRRDAEEGHAPNLGPTEYSSTNGPDISTPGGRLATSKEISSSRARVEKEYCLSWSTASCGQRFLSGYSNPPTWHLPVHVCASNGVTRSGRP